MNRKADLSLSITAIVVIVIAFVVLGLGLSLTKLIFKGATAKLPEAFAVTQLEAEPTSENPITIPQTVEIDKGKSKTMNIGYYNKGSTNAYGAKFQILSCLKTTNEVVLAEQLPTIASVSQKVGPSSAGGYSLVITEKGVLNAGTYICTIGVVCDSATAVSQEGTCPAGASSDNPTNPYEKKQFFLNVIA